jgi:hypothetical protein
VLWVFSVARVSAAVSVREVFGAEVSVAFICAFAALLGLHAPGEGRALEAAPVLR